MIRRVRRCGTNGNGLSAGRAGSGWKTLLLALLLLPAVEAAAQPPHDTKGTEFWVTFMQNNGSGGDFEKSDMRMYVSSDTITTVRIRYTPLDDTLVLRITRPNVPFEVDVSGLFGSNVELDEVLNNGANAISRKSFHILSDHDITLYGVNIRVMSADAFLSLPDDVLTGRYIVTAWQNGYLGSGDFDMHSQFAVIATEDGTTVRVSPSTLLSGRNSTQPFVMTLDRGQVYFGQAQTGLPNDVTGTEIRANKPVAVYAGNQRTSVPASVGNFRDHLVEQMPPIDAWGSTAILTPHYTITPGSTLQAEARILAAFDSTRVEVTTESGTTVYNLDSRQTAAIRPLRGAFVSADKPILVAQYEHSVALYTDSGPTGEGGLAELGDPFMMLIPAPEQYDTAYAFQSVNHEEFLKHYINVIVPFGAETSLVLDGMLLQNLSFTPIPGTFYSVAQIPVSPGSHYIEADQQFGLCVYGFGRANSYGYPGGTLFRTLVTDFERPHIGSVQECDILQGIVSDDRLTDSGIDSCYATGGMRNVNVRIEPFAAGADTVRWSAQLTDPYQDGVVEIRGIDGAGRSTLYRTAIPGFTVSVSGDGAGGLPTEEIVSFNGKETCGQVVLHNYGAFPQTVTRLNGLPALPVGAALSAALPITLMPGETRAVRICYGGAAGEPATFELEAGSDCIGRNVARVRLVSVIDTLPPERIGTNTPCGGARVDFSEPDQPYLLIESLVVDTLVNGRYTTDPTAFSLPARRISLHLTPEDFREDMIYQATVTDRAGNRQTIRDTISGFTVAVHETPVDDRLAIRLERDWTSDTLSLNTMRCDSLLLVNYGARALNVARILMMENHAFSIPPAQLPIVLEPGSARKFAVCLEGRTAGEQIDTLLILDECGRWENVLLRTPVRASEGSGADMCGSRISVQSYGAAKRTFLTVPAPNPYAGGELFVDVGLRQDERVTLRLLDLSGQQTLRVLEYVPMTAGLHRVVFTADGLADGLYFCRMETSGGETITQKLIIRD